jgi:peptidoglycan hydrolase-like protein with peptidoglycan-binding domain
MKKKFNVSLTCVIVLLIMIVVGVVNIDRSKSVQAYAVDMSKIQIRLSELGYYDGVINGLYDDATVVAIKNFQKDNGIYVSGATLKVENSTVYQHISGRHAIYNWSGNITVESGSFDSESGNELILADGTNASVVLNGGTYNKTAKSWLLGAATNKNISFVINGGTYNGYVNLPENTVDTIRPYGDPIVVKGGSFNFNPTQWLAEGYEAVNNNSCWTVQLK